MLKEYSAVAIDLATGKTKEGFEHKPTHTQKDFIAKSVHDFQEVVLRNLSNFEIDEPMEVLGMMSSVAANFMLSTFVFTIKGGMNKETVLASFDGITKAMRTTLEKELTERDSGGE